MVISLAVAKDWKLPSVHQQGTGLMKCSFKRVRWALNSDVKLSPKFIIRFKKSKVQNSDVILLPKKIMCILCKCIEFSCKDRKR